MQTSLQHRRSSTIVRASLDKRQVQLRSQTVRPPAPHRPLNREQKQKLVFFSQHWLPRLLQTQEDAHETYHRISGFGELLATEVGKAQSRLSEVMQGVLAPFAADLKNQRPGSRPRSPLLQALQDPARLRELSSPEGLPDELTGIVAQIQATNQRLRELENNYQAVDSSLLVLQEGAEMRDQETMAYRDALLQLAEDLETQEREEAARVAEAARIAAEARRLEEMRRDEQLRRELEELVSAASAVQATEANLAVAQTSADALRGAPPIKVEVGVQLQTKPGQNVVLVGSHPSLGSWSVDDALPMTWSDGHVWKASIELPPDSMDLEYKAVLRSSSGKDVWEKGTNHKADLQGSCDISLYHVFQA
ncbi:hypothetical protein OEZ85_010339 [Tetradesmus obliquus]|uniref:CBM20 domain-containing protein n=1 Tax=Tetradesmus obliquus TaxID=3088 RepID=A0ABY8TM00_TETOB|nr:hypothetical protein OEZ85_010339 [Tetradesmus obliquus]